MQNGTVRVEHAWGHRSQCAYPDGQRDDFWERAFWFLFDTIPNVVVTLSCHIIKRCGMIAAAGQNTRWRMVYCTEYLDRCPRCNPEDAEGSVLRLSPTIDYRTAHSNAAYGGPLRGLDYLYSNRRCVGGLVPSPHLLVLRGYMKQGPTR